MESTKLAPEQAVQRARLVCGALLAVQVTFALAATVIAAVTGPLQASTLFREGGKGQLLVWVAAGIGVLLVLAAWGLLSGFRARAAEADAADVPGQFWNGTLVFAAILEGGVMLNLVVVLLLGWTPWTLCAVGLGIGSAMAGFPRREALEGWRRS